LVNKICAFANYLRPNGGGVTATGGEPLVQSGFVAQLFKAVRDMGLTTCLDTTGQGAMERDWDAVLPLTDRVLFCLEHIDPLRYRALTGKCMQVAMKFADRIRAYRVPFQLRYVLIPGYTDAEEDVDALVAWAAKQPTLEFIELLPYHELGKHKWEEMGLRYKFTGVMPPTRDQIMNFIYKCRNASLSVKCVHVQPQIAVAKNPSSVENTPPRLQEG
jgi:pyruvate formate lyase activating enzyme